MSNRQWTAKWIWADTESASVYSNEMVLFRKSFQLSEAIEDLSIHISADSRYQLFLNGVRMGVGPCKGDRHTQYYETYDVTPWLRTGLNMIAVRVLHYAPGGPSHAAGSSAIMRSPWGGFLLEAEATCTETPILETDGSWLCIRDESYRLENESWISGNWMGGVERVDGAVRPHGWEQLDYDDSQWQPVRIMRETWNRWGVLYDWPLAPRPIPMMYEELREFIGVKRAEGWPLDQGMARVADSVIAANSTAWIELDAGELTTGYLQIAMSSGVGSTIRLISSECYERIGPDGKRLKGVRDEASEGQVLLGDSDQYKVAGAGESKGKWEVYEPYWFKTFRFVRLEVETGDVPLVFHRLDYRETGYPLEAKAEFRCSDEYLDSFWPISIRTLQRCMHETYEDCPYYEQLQYTMDTALQMQFTYRLSGDDRLARKAIHDFHSSRLPDGMLQCRYPTVEPQVIPGFALYWVLMIRDHYMYYGDKSLLRQYMPTADGVLEWFRQRLQDDGLVGPFPREYWSYIDWVVEWRNGVPGAAEKGPITVSSLMYAAALNAAAELHDAIERTSLAAEYRGLARTVHAAVQSLCWSEEEGLYRDGPTVEAYSQHVQVWSILSGLQQGEDGQRLMRRTMARSDLAAASYSMSYFLFRALEEAGAYDLAYPLWDQWRGMVDLHLTTWIENPNGARSDCHAWGALPLYEFPSVILGVRPLEPGFGTIGIQPQPGPLQFAEGSCITPHGAVHVKWRIQHDEFILEVEGPADIPVVVRMPDGQQWKFESSRHVRIEHTGVNSGLPEKGE